MVAKENSQYLQVALTRPPDKEGPTQSTRNISKLTAIVTTL